MKRPHLPLIEGSVEDCATALQVSFDRLSMAATNAKELLHLAGVAGAKGDTADDLHNALAIHGHLLHQYQVKIRTAGHTDVYTTSADSSCSAFNAAAARQGDTPCGITVLPAPVDLDRLALAAAHRTLGITKPLDDALDHPSLGRALRTYARKHPVRRPAITDFKSLAANDRD